MSPIKTICYNWYKSGNTLEKNAYKAQEKVKGQYARKSIPNSGTNIKRNGQGNGKVFPKSGNSLTSTTEKYKENKRRNSFKIQSLGVIEEDCKIPEKPTNRNSNSILGLEQTVLQTRQDEIKIEKATRDSLYKWYGNVEKARFDVDKDLNHFNQITKSTAKDFSYAMR